MKNNELTEVKPVMPSLEGLPQEVIEYVHGLVAENAALSKLKEGELYIEVCRSQDGGFSLCIGDDDIVLRQGGNRRDFSPEEWRVICMAADSDMDNRLYTATKAMDLRQQRWEEDRQKLLSRIAELEKKNG